MPVLRRKKETTSPPRAQHKSKPPHRYLISKHSSSICTSWQEPPFGWSWRTVWREELEAVIGVGWGESGPNRKGYRNGYYTREPFHYDWSARRRTGSARS